MDVGQDRGADPNNPIAGAQAGILTIEPGVRLYGSGGLDYINVQRGSQIFAEGTATNPIIFTSRSNVDGNSGADLIGQWGGIVIAGRAPIASCPAGTTPPNINCVATFEGGISLYGGNSPTDNSGRLRYIQVRYPGFEVQPNRELNGITFLGVGSATVVENIQVHNSSDDGMEFFGGTVRLKRIIITGADDDSIDTDEGWQGGIQFLIARQRANGGDRVFEQSSVGVQTALPSRPVIANYTAIGSTRTGAGDIQILNTGTSGRFVNGIHVSANTATACIDVDTPSTVAAAPALGLGRALLLHQLPQRQRRHRSRGAGAVRRGHEQQRQLHEHPDEQLRQRRQRGGGHPVQPVHAEQLLRERGLHRRRPRCERHLVAGLDLRPDQRLELLISRGGALERLRPLRSRRTLEGDLQMTKKSRPLAGLLLCTTALLAPGLVHAQQAQDNTEVEEIIVRGKYIPEVMRETSEVASIVTPEDLARQGDDTAAEALTRLAGLSVVGGRFVYVRGLGERYSSALLNGSPLPSPEPLQRVVPLDLFPSNVLAGVNVQKTYSPNLPGEFGGGLIDIRTVDIPDDPYFAMSVSVGMNDETTLKPGLTYYGGDWDGTGVDDGTRELPLLVRRGIETGKRIDSSNFTPDQLTQIGRSFQNANINLLQQTNDVPFDGKFDISGGTSWSFDSFNVGFVAVAGYDSELEDPRRRPAGGHRQPRRPVDPGGPPLELDAERHRHQRPDQPGAGDGQPYLQVDQPLRPQRHQGDPFGRGRQLAGLELHPRRLDGLVPARADRHPADRRAPVRRPGDRLARVLCAHGAGRALRASGPLSPRGRRVPAQSAGRRQLHQLQRARGQGDRLRYRFPLPVREPADRRLHRLRRLCLVRQRAVLG
ncbi:TonB-dependent receptor plug domain-containing protein [Phenylobacterium sp. J367]|uniref:TonB-dependent receptor plug domain-containing protein n=1 Tax=Phenylobacterium sp. J367 TaxID=2898435 RepID=UPI0021516370|nr:TonB-dependent receptor plug domain-containing protein [Phenylobacterium sp. J367]MCR5881101.1 TonB-dependent receptor plug domain-containing protein [Phenylobacterium sp. J367]